MKKYQFKSLDEKKRYMSCILSSKEYERWLISLDDVSRSNEALQLSKKDMLVSPLVEH